VSLAKVLCEQALSSVRLMHTLWEVLESGLAISMASAIAANACLISRFLERNVRGSTMLAMMFLTIHGTVQPFSLAPLLMQWIRSDIINIITVSIFGYRGRKNDGFTYAQAYWFTVASTIVSTVTNVTLLIDFIRTRDIASSGSGLTRKQRSLVIVVILLFSWVAVGAGCFCALLHISFQDSLYYTVVSMESTLIQNIPALVADMSRSYRLW
jgi:potassium channel subfamily K